jgi:flavin reductase ActVB
VRPTAASAGVAVAEPKQVRVVARDSFREAMSHLASGVVLVTADVDGRPWGMTVSSCCSVCDDPPTVLVSLAERTVLAKAIADTGRFAINVLAQDGIELARFGSTNGQPKFLDEGFQVGRADSERPTLTEALTQVDCDLAQTVAHGDHTLYLGRVHAVTISAASAPLLYYRRDYHRLEPTRVTGGQLGTPRSGP